MSSMRGRGRRSRRCASAPGHDDQRPGRPAASVGDDGRARAAVARRRHLGAVPARRMRAAGAGLGRDVRRGLRPGPRARHRRLRRRRPAARDGAGRAGAGLVLRDRATRCSCRAPGPVRSARCSTPDSAGARVVLHERASLQDDAPEHAPHGARACTSSTSTTPKRAARGAAAPAPAAVYVQHVPQALGDAHEVGALIELAQAECGDGVRIARRRQLRRDALARARRAHGRRRVGTVVLQAARARPDRRGGRPAPRSWRDPA